MVVSITTIKILTSYLPAGSKRKGSDQAQPSKKKKKTVDSKKITDFMKS